MEKPNEPSLKHLLRSNLWNPVKTIHFLYGPLWSLEGHGSPWQSWFQGTMRTPRKLHKKFHKNQKTGSMLNGNFSRPPNSLLLDPKVFISSSWYPWRMTVNSKKSTSLISWDTLFKSLTHFTMSMFHQNVKFKITFPLNEPKGLFL